MAAEADFAPCVRRLNLIAFRADGTKDKIFRCSEQSAPLYGTDVQPADCLDCPVRRLVLKANEDSRPRHGMEPKNILSKKKDPGGDGFLSCSDRLVVIIPACCGSTAERGVCNNDEASQYKGEVTPIICSQCTVRRSDTGA